MKPDSDSNSHKIAWQNRKFRIYRESSKGSWRTFFRIKGTLYLCTLETHLKAAAIERALNEIIKPALNGGKPRQEEKLEPVTIPGTFGAVVDLYKQWALIEPHSIRANYHAAWRIIAATHDRFKRYSGAARCSTESATDFEVDDPTGEISVCQEGAICGAVHGGGNYDSGLRAGLSGVPGGRDESLEALRSAVGQGDR
jgi:hypothetical protein